MCRGGSDVPLRQSKQQKIIRQMKIYVIYECNAHRNYHSFVIKWMTTAFVKAKAFYERCNTSYLEDREWFFNLAEYEVDTDEASDESDMLRNLTTIFTTEE